MKKVVFIAIMAVFTSFSVFSQKIESSKVDDFTGKKVIYTSKEKITSESMTNFKQTMFQFRYENETMFLHLFWQCREIMSVTDGSNIIFKMTDDSNITLKSIGNVIAEKGVASTKSVQIAGLWGLALKYTGEDLNRFSEDIYVKKFRIYTTKGYVDFDVKEKDAQKLKELFSILIEEIKK